ncbi:hypothetical protein CR513_01779, partial [Mucuna pruriens]
MVVEFKLISIHISHSISLAHILYLHGGARCLHWCFSRSRKRGSWTKRPKVVKGDRLACYRTLVDLILSVLSNRGEPSSSSMAIVMEDGSIEFTPYVGIPEDYIKMKAFPFSLDGAAKDWLYLQQVLFNTWGDMKCMLLEKFFPASKTTTIRKKICGVKQHPRETLHEYWERFNKLCATCPHHQISEQLLIQYFYEGLPMMDRSMIDAAIGGALMDKTSVATRHLISNMASNTQQFGIRRANQSRMLTELTSLVRQLVVGQHQPSVVARVCGICTSVEHPTDMCPTLQETESDYLESVGAIGGYQYGKQLYQSRSSDIQQFGKQPFRPGPSQRPYAAKSSTTTPQYQTPPFQQQQQRMLAQGNSPSLEDLMNNLPSQTIPNPRGNASVVTLRSGKALPQPAPQQLPRSTDVDSELDADSRVLQQEKIVPFPFPTWAVSTRKPNCDEELLRMFRKVEINIPLLDAIKQVPKYAKFLKELFIHKRKKMKGSVEVGGIVSTLTRNEDFTTRA